MDARLDDLVLRLGFSYGYTAKALLAEFPTCGLNLTKNSIAGHYHQRRKRAKLGKPLPAPQLHIPAERTDWFRRWATEPASHPFVRRLFEVMNRQRCTGPQFYKRSGLTVGTLSNWRRARPNIADLEAAFNVFDMTLLPHLKPEGLGRPPKHKKDQDNVVS